MKSNIVLQDAPKTYTFDQDKAESPERTVRRIKEVLKKAGLDILKETLRVDAGRLGIPVYVSLCGSEALRTIGTKKQMGKGATPEQAEASALAELVERFSFFHFLENHPFLISDYEHVADDALPFPELAKSVHHDSLDLDRAREALEGIPLKWAWAKNLTTDEDVLVPVDWFYEINQFNGPSAGNRLEEAVLQGICEVVERHVSALVCRGMLEVADVDFAGPASSAARELVDKYEKVGIKLHVKDFTLDMGIPTIGALAWDPTTFPQRSEIVFTAGTATDPEKAFIRALTEIAQLAGDFDTTGEYVASGLPKPSRLDEVQYIVKPGGDQVGLNELPNLSHENIRVEVERCVTALARKGFQVLALNTTHPVLEFPAVYIMIPGCHFRERSRGTSVPFFAAKLCFQAFPPDQAVERLKRLSRLYPDKYYLEYYQGVCHAHLERQDKALEHFSRAMELSPAPEDASTIQCYKGICYKDMERFEQAIRELEEAVRMDPDCKEAYNAMGFCRFKLKEHEKAIECFENALRIDPGSAIDYANIATNLRELGRIDEAIRLYGMALELDDSLDFAKRNLEFLRRKQDGLAGDE